MAISYTALVLFVSLIKIKEPEGIGISHFDKIIHIGIYFICTLVWFMVFAVKSCKPVFYKKIVKASLVAFVIGVVIEILQELNPNARSGDINDVLANAVGILLAIAVIVKFKKYQTLNSTK